MNANFNRQFILIDFQLLKSREYLQFLGPRQGIYLLLRRYVYRSTKTHPNNLDRYFAQGNLVSSLTQEKISELTGWSLRTISGHISEMIKSGIIQSIPTGRASVYVLGERRDVSREGESKQKWIELFFLEQTYGLDHSAPSSEKPEKEKSKPVNEAFRTDTQNSADQISSSARQRGADTQDIAEHNIDIINKQINNTSASALYHLPPIQQDKAKTEYLRDFLVEEFNNPASSRFYYLVASRVSEPIIREFLKAVKTSDSARNPAAVFTNAIIEYAESFDEKVQMDENKRRVDSLKMEVFKSM